MHDAQKYVYRLIDGDIEIYYPLWLVKNDVVSYYNCNLCDFDSADDLPPNDMELMRLFGALESEMV